MSRMPVLSRDEMDPEQREVHDAILTTTGRVGRGPAIGFAYSAGLWRIHDASSAQLNSSSLTQLQIRIVSLMTARHWNAAYPWSAQAASAASAGVEPAVVEAINAGEQPEFAEDSLRVIHTVARELLATGTLGEAAFKAAEATIGYQRLADVVGVIGHFSATAMMANVAGVEPFADASSHLKP